MQGDEILTFERSEVTIGRTERNADIVLRDANVSRRHCALRSNAEGKLVLVDLGSTNGLWLNDGRGGERTVLKAGDTLYVGDFVITLLDEPERV